MKTKLKKLLFLFALSSAVWSCASKTKNNDSHISNFGVVIKNRVAMFDALIDEIDRVDTDRKAILKEKGETWNSNINEIRAEVQKATTPEELGRAFKKVDALYPHVQSQQVLNPDLESVPLGSKVVLPFKMTPSVDDKNEQHFKYFISQVSPDDFDPGDIPKIGDEVVEINKKGIDEWEQENFILCKATSYIVCALELNHNFRNEALSWNHHSNVELKLLRGADKLTAKLKPKIEVSAGFEPSENSDVYNDIYPCGVDIKRRYYQFGFLYKGRRLCALGSHTNPGVVVLRVSNFNYISTDDSIHSVRQEVDQFKTAYWNDHVAGIKHLIIDLIDNEGGESPIPYEQLLFDRPFQGQYIKYKKLKEWSDDPIDENLFTVDGDGGKSIWLKSLREEGTYDKTIIGGYYDPIPRYCVSSKLDCRRGRFEPEETHFKGDVRVMLNQNCILACSSLAYDLSEHLSGRVWFYGLPDSGDPLSLQVAINLYATPTSAKPFAVKSQVWNSAAPPVMQDLLLTQTVVFTQTTDAGGNLISGQGRKIRKMPALNYKNYPTNYPGEVLKTILKDIK